MVVIQRGLEDINNLKRGFDVVYIENYNYPVDALFMQETHLIFHVYPEITCQLLWERT